MSTLFAFWAVSMLFVITPGMDWAYAIQAGIRGRSLQGVSGLLLGHTLLTSIVIAGLGVIISTQPMIMKTLIILGATYLLWMGIGSFFHPSSPSDSGKEIMLSPLRWVFKGIGVSGLNPKVFLLILALLPQFIDAQSSFSTLTQLLILGLIHLINCSVVYFLVGFSSQKVLRSRPSLARGISRVSGAAMIAVTALMVFEQIL